MDATQVAVLKILIVDAQADDRALLRQQLRGLPELEFSFDEACSGEEAVEKAERSGFQSSCLIVHCLAELEWAG